MPAPILGIIGAILARKGLPWISAKLGIGGKPVLKIIGDVIGADIDNEDEMIKALEKPENILALTSLKEKQIDGVIELAQEETKRHIADTKGGSWLSKNIRPLSLGSSVLVFAYNTGIQAPEYIIEAAKDIVVYFGGMYILLRSVMDKPGNGTKGLMGTLKGLIKK